MVVEFSRRWLLLVALPLLLIAGAERSAAQPRKVPARLFAEARDEGSVRVIAQLDTQTQAEGAMGDRRSVASQRRRISSDQATLARDLGTTGRVVRSFASIPFLALEVDSAGLDALERSALVVAVEPDRIEHATLAQSAPLVQADLARAAGFDGEGTSIALLDTGVDAEHPFFAGRVVSEACYSAGGSCPNQEATQLGTGAAAPCSYAPGTCRHGTHVAGIAAGAGTNSSGVAPGADLIAIQVFSRFEGSVCDAAGEDPCAAAFTSDQIAGLERVLELRETFSIAAVNMSLGGDQPFPSQAECDQQNAARKAAIDNLRSVGVATVVASGNEGFTEGLTSPSCISSAISVGATSKEDAVAPFSNSAPYLSLLAPGVLIESSVPGGEMAGMSGTSMAAPHVAGAFAVLRERFPRASVNNLLQRLRETGAPVIDLRNDVSTPRILLRDALNLAVAGKIGVFENPVNGGFTSGIGAFTGWVCDAEVVAFRVDGGPPMRAGYGTPRGDTLDTCGDGDNGVSLLFNFNLLGDGAHTAELIADGFVIGSSTFTVATLGVSFLPNGPETTYVLRDFADRDVFVRWSGSQQGFVIVGYE